MAPDQQESSHLLKTVNYRIEPNRQPECLHTLLEAQVGETPDAVAVIFEAQHLTYAELDARANQVARHLRNLGVQRGSLVGIFAERSLEMVIALYATLKAGAAYVPIDPAYPAERVTFMLQDAQVPVLLTQAHLFARVPPYHGQIVTLERDWAVIGKRPRTILTGHEKADDLAYMIYTSGSTGQPKGAMNTHGGICNRLLWMQGAFGLQADDRVLQKTPFSFDVSVWELFWPLLVGAQLVMARPGGHRDSTYLLDLIRREGITTLHFVPSMLQSFVREPGMEVCGRVLRRVLSSGEALSVDLQALFFKQLPSVALHNLYGPTEAAVDVTAWTCRHDLAGTTVPIGHPITNIHISLLDAHQQLVPLRQTGELHIGGIGLARGYHRRPDLTAERFIPDPVGTSPGGRLYKTGDLARYRPDGTLDYLGRLDHQVKIRGFRIELGEIEAALAQHPTINESVVVAWPDQSGAQRLVAYLVVAPPNRPTTTDLLSWLKRTLPDYMLPSQFVFLESFPLTPNGKIDRKALPQPDTQRPQLEAPYVSPSTPQELALAEIWSQALEVTPVGIHDNFFELGGDSIRAIQVLAHAQQRGMSFTLEQLFTDQTIHSLVQQLDQDREPRLQPGCPKPFDLISPEDRNRLPGGLEDAYPLTQLQIGMFYHNEQYPASAIFHDIFTFRIQYPFHHEHLQLAVDRFIKRHAPMRTSFDLGSFTEPLQLVHPSAFLFLVVEDLQHLDSTAQTEALDAWIEVEKRRPFNTTRAPLLRILVHRYSPDVFQLIVSFHHLILDGWSLAVMLTEILQDYSGLLGGTTAPVAPPVVPYRAYVASELRALAAEDSRQFWIEKLQDPDIQLLPRWPESYRAGGSEQVRSPEIRIPGHIFEGLKALALKAKVPLKSVLMAAHHRVMNVLHGRPDVISGLITNGRPEEIDGDRMIGLFLNTVPVRLRLNGGTWFELVQHIFRTEHELMPHRRFPLSAIQQAIGRNILFETAFNFVHFHVYHNLDRHKGMGFVEGQYFEANNFTLFPTFMIDIPTAQLQMHIDYDPSELGAKQIEAICGYYLNTLSSMASQPHARYDTFSPLSHQERSQQLLDWNNTTRNYPSGKVLHILFEEQVRRTPDAVAIIDGIHSLSYTHLNQRANRLAHYLVSRGVGPDVLVGLCVERSLEMIVAMLAILKAGGAYVPLDPAYPKPWLAAVLENTQAPLLLTQTRFQSGLPNLPLQVICLDEGWQATEGIPEALGPATDVTPDHLAYVLYTSGSTGQPKGVAIPHHGPVALIHWAREQFPLDELAGVLASTSICFDLSVFELFVPLSCGGTVFLAENALALPTLPEASHVTLINSVPSAMRELLRLQSVPPSVRVVNLAGEPLRTALVQEIYALPYIRKVYDLYGPTEDTTYSTVALRSANGPDTIGRPIANEQIYLVNENQLLLPVGVAGEMLIGGDGLARGYYQRPDLTAEQFLPHPFSPHPGARVYRSGDLGRFRPDGMIEYLGRRDHQVKVRGFRIESGEIESILYQHPAVKNAVVLCREDKTGEKQLVAYVICQAKDSLSTTNLRAFVQQKLPDYMIPTAFMMLDAMPLTSNGKIDRRALPAPDNLREQLETVFVLPRTFEEELLAGIWAATLNIQRIGIHDNFFALGGHSLLATRIISKIRSVFSVELPIRTLFENPTVAGISTAVVQARQGEEPSAKPNLQPVPRKGFLPLSFAQERFWVLDQLHTDRSVFNVPSMFRLSGPLQFEVFQQSVQAMVDCHEILRTTFVGGEGQPYQVIAPTFRVDVPLVACAGLSEEEQTAVIQQTLQEEWHYPFDLAQGPLFRFRLIRLGEEDYLLVLNLHHIIHDAWSFEVIIQDLVTAYTAGCAGQAVKLPAQLLQYADYAQWQRELVETQVGKRQLVYWKSQLAQLPPPLPLPTDYARPAAQTFRGACVRHCLGAELITPLRALNRQEGTTLFMVFLATLQFLLHRLTGTHDILVGAPIAGRVRQEFQGLIGCFLNTLVLRTNLAGLLTGRDLLKKVREVVLEAYENQDVPFEKVVAEVQPVRDPSRTPIFQVLLNMHSFNDYTLPFPELIVRRVHSTTMKSLFDITLYFSETAEEVEISLVYNADLFSAERMNEFMQQFQYILAQIITAPDRLLEAATLVTPSARVYLPDPQKPMVTEWKGHLWSRLAHHAQHQKESVAMVSPRGAWTYRTLEEHSNQLAHNLLNQGVQAQGVVAIYANRSPELVLALMGILKAGAAFMILDPSYPAARLLDMLQIAEPCGVIHLEETGPLPTELEAWAATLPCHVRVPAMTGIEATILTTPWDHASTAPPGVQVQPDDVAYLIFTSGSTGTPKCLQGTHRPLSHFLHWYAHALDLTAADRVTMFSGLAHDPLLRDIFTPLWVGGTLCIPDPVTVALGRLGTWLQEQSITLMHLTPALVDILTVGLDTDKRIWPSLRYAVFGGESLWPSHPARLQRLAPQARCVNAYGATETPQIMSLYMMPTEHSAREDQIPIGQGIEGVQVLIRNSGGYLAGIGEPGEIHIRTPYLTRGYVNDATLTAARFITNPFYQAEVGDRLYRTGDLGRYRPDGTVEYLGREDRQVKLRGYRIELGEIESAVNQHPAVSNAVVLCRKDTTGEKQLVAYVLPVTEAGLELATLRTYLQSKLPDYMLPAAFVVLEAFPLTPNGKVDWRALPAPDQTHRLQATDFVQPRTPLQELLAEIWRDLLKVDQISVHDNFFELGGHSLLATQVVARLRHILDLDLPLRTLFEHPTVAQFANEIDTQLTNAFPDWPQDGAG